MSSALTIRAALTRGAIVALANWPIVLIEFVVETAYKFAMGVPVVGGAFMVAVLLGADVRSLLGEGLLSAADQIVGLLANAPAALAAFTAALALVGVAGAVIMFVVKAGTLAVLVHGEAAAGDDRHPIGLGTIHNARAYSLESVWRATRRFEKRAATLALGLGVIYVALGGLYLLAVVYGFRWVAESAWAAAWPLLILLATSGVAVGITLANLWFDLARVVVVTDDCGVGVALRQVKVFLLEDARQVLGIFGVMGTFVLLALAASLTATAGMTMVAWVPLLGLLVVPLQVAFWIVRGLLFQYMSLTTLSAYQAQYRRFRTPRTEPVAIRVHSV